MPGTNVLTEIYEMRTFIGLVRYSSFFFFNCSSKVGQTIYTLKCTIQLRKKFDAGGQAINLEKANDKNALKRTPPDMPLFGGRLFINNALTDDKHILVG